MSLRAAARIVGTMLLLAALWTAALPLTAASAPEITALLPDHSHTTLRGVAAEHTHATEDGEGCRAADTDEAIACGAAGVAAFGTFIPGAVPAPVVPVAAILAARLAEPAVHRSPATDVSTPPPRA